MKGPTSFRQRMKETNPTPKGGALRPVSTHHRPTRRRTPSEPKGRLPARPPGHPPTQRRRITGGAARSSSATDQKAEGAGAPRDEHAHARSANPVAILPNLNGPADLRGLSQAQLEELAREIRETIISTVARTGGHRGSALGV